MLSSFSSPSRVRIAHATTSLCCAYIANQFPIVRIGWKRLVLSDGPRQAINCLTLYSFWLVNQGDLDKIESYWTDQPLVTKLLLLSILFTVIIFLGSLLILIAAAICYIPLLCYIQGNLKEYCCHKVDKVSKHIRYLRYLRMGTAL